MEKNIIQLVNVTKSYKIYEKQIDRLKEALSPIRQKHHKDFKALNNISISIKRGESVGIVGVNGSGKSTFLKLIAGVVTPTSGEIKINGKVSAILELGAGFNPEYTGIENIYLNGTIMGYERIEIDQKLESILSFAEIGDFIYQPVKTYSSGMFARLAFAVAINVEPDILIVDEALSVGDTKFQLKCIEKMKHIRENGTTILFVSHAIEQIKRFCTRAIWIDKGFLRDDGSANDIVNIYEDSLYLDTKSSEDSKDIDLFTDISESFSIPVDSNEVGRIVNVSFGSLELKTFDTLQVDILYDVYDEAVPNLLVGVAIYDRDRKYIFGPNTYLDKVEIPFGKGRHSIQYRIPRIPLLSGTYFIDVGLFSEKGLVMIDYKTSIEQFTIKSEYFTEGLAYIEHEWRVVK
ncbi:teichoic acid ABC transporter ATP-binding protein [Paenibacillus sp. Soil766]|uniref:ABC transporter ATP-binding protein n=1 Tax=Paenibacillus sp. Soil766 TaxID=1736404 RepID=UPI00070A041C|nr:ABC transporter ATP-binding protein [Paenibacillus sp. Soil766]KRE86373.1 teichoic acid ABC transporter ATP-binding protein [Paenibacillus sp. Soil766]